MSADAVAEELATFVRSRTELPMRDLVRGALASARLVAGEAPSLVRASEPRRSFFRTPWALSLFGAALALGLGVVRATDRAGEHQSAGVEGPLLPGKPGFLRVLATPWAEVSVDGQHAAITPVARAIPLAPGVHFVRFTHPSAPSQTRRVTIQSAETETLDVTMDIAGARDAGGP